MHSKPSGQWIYSDAEGEEGNIIDVMFEEKWSWQQIITFADKKFLPLMSVMDENRIAANGIVNLG
ncbi:hypothetical protein Aasi_1683 [Candidatus Amoebophilus asiaticus 5a2]|uniref:Uncharacterized protein n=1 Tax=Amoebophilus asiaticus (strain 5a2) TaxID=452471 RepID=C3L3T9_AMOA5|nr:hypothetical protein [Candidatus Amoebophilus asiaticus]ACP20980.1 hypothetical protein Aasi_1683 [Candidatus Amoebophilus asiaticus 5a2]